MTSVTVGNVTIGGGAPVLIGGPCMAESLELCCEVAAYLKELTAERGILLPRGQEGLLNGVVDIRRASEDPHRGPPEHPELIFDQLFKDLFPGFHTSSSNMFLTIRPACPAKS